MSHLQARIGPKVTKLYPNQSWIRPGADPTCSKTRNTDEKEYDSDASSRASQTLSKGSRADLEGSPSRPSQPLSLLTRMGLNPVTEAEDVQQPSLSTQVRTSKDTSYPSPSPNNGRDITRVLDYHDITHSKDPQTPLPSLSNGQENPMITENQPPGNISSLKHPDSDQMKYNDDLFVKPLTKEATSLESPHKPILHDSSKSNFPPSNGESSQTRSKDNLTTSKNIIPFNFSLPRVQDIEEGELVDLPPEQVRDLLLPLMLKNAAHRVKNGDSGLSHQTAQSVLSDETQPTEQLEAALASLSSKIGQPPPLGPRAMMLPHAPKPPRPLMLPIETGNYIPPNGEIATITSPSDDISQPISAVSNHFHYPLSSPTQRRREPSFRRTPSPERDHDQGRRYRLDGHRSHSRSHSSSRHSRGKPYHRQSDLSRDMARSRSPVTLATSPRPRPRSPLPYRRRSPSAGTSQSNYFRDGTFRESPEEVSNRRSGSPSGSSSYGRMSERRHSFRRIEGNLSPRWDAADSPQTPAYPFSRSHFGHRDADEVYGPRSPSFPPPPESNSHDRMPERRQSFSRNFRRIEGNLSPRWDTADSPQTPAYPFSRSHFGQRDADEVSGPRSPPSGSNHDRMPERRQSFSRNFRRIEGNLSPSWNASDSPQPPVYSFSRGLFGQRDADEVSRPRSPSFTHDRGPVLDKSPRRRRDSQVGSIAHSGPRFARRSASPPRRQQHRQVSAERPLRHMPPRTTPRAATPKPYHQLPRKQASLEQSVYMESSSPETGSISSHLADGIVGHHHHHAVEKPMVIDKEDMQGRVNEEVGMRSGDATKSGLIALPCHNVPGIWFVKVALGNIGTLECSFEVDEITTLKWSHKNVNLQKEKLQLQICCLSQKLVQSVMDSLKPDATAQDVTAAMLEIENDWPTPGHLIIVVNPQVKNRKIWLPNKLEPPYLPVCIEDCISQGQNTVQFIQLSAMSDKMFILFATSRPLELQHVDHEEFVHAPLQNTIDGGKGDVFDIGLGEVTIADSR